LILAFDTAGAACSVAVGAGAAILELADLAMPHGQAEALLPLVEQTMQQAGVPTGAIDLVAVTIGPGSFTGIRVGLAAAQGIALGLGVPLVGVTGFEAAIAALHSDAHDGHSLLVAIESRRTDFYVQLFDAARRPLAAPAAVLPEALGETVHAALGEAPLAITGDAAPRAAAALSAQGLTGVIAAAEPMVAGALRRAFERWRCGERSAPARPFYLRPPDVTVASGPSSRPKK
jgi:tRNA threonylcarbamoyladenosine biosynthesis protein TsaB